MEYSAAELKESASKLYALAKPIMLETTDMGAVFGAAVGLLIGTAGGVSSETFEIALVISGLGAVSGGLYGGATGRRRAPALRLEAQSALCLFEMEQRTRENAGDATETS